VHPTETMVSRLVDFCNNPPFSLSDSVCSICPCRHVVIHVSPGSILGSYQEWQLYWNGRPKNACKLSSTYRNDLTPHPCLVGGPVGRDGASQRSGSRPFSPHTTTRNWSSYVPCMRACQLHLIKYHSLQGLTSPATWLPPPV
jgi:hypothetical protein